MGIHDFSETLAGPVLLSWLSEWVYCKRRFYLRIAEDNHLENQFIVEGNTEHQNAHMRKIEKRGKKVKVTGLYVCSKALNICGICDAVEFIEDERGAWIPFLGGTYVISPVEYKHGKTRNEKEYNLQTAAQGMCLEEMYCTTIQKIFVYYKESNERYEIQMTSEIRDSVRQAVGEITAYLANPYPIKPAFLKRCHGCSMEKLCSPRKILVEDYMNRVREKYMEGKV